MTLSSYISLYFFFSLLNQTYLIFRMCLSSDCSWAEILYGREAMLRNAFIRREIMKLNT